MKVGDLLLRRKRPPMDAKGAYGPLFAIVLPWSARLSVFGLLCAQLLSLGSPTVSHAATDVQRFCLPNPPNEKTISALVGRPSLRVNYAPDILIVVLDTLRADRVHKSLMPNLHRWYQKSLHAKRTLAAATSTDHSLFSIFFMRPAFEREFQFAARWSSGSTALQLARAVGYEVRLFAYPSWYASPLPQPRAANLGPWSNRATFELLFGQNGQLLQYCPQPLGEHTDESKFFETDRALIDQYVADTVQLPGSGALPPPRLDILHLYGTHDPYGVDSDAPNLRKPWLDGEFCSAFVPPRSKIEAAETRERLRNTYDNAAISLDRNVGYLLQKLSNRDGPLQRFVVIVSDHGETLPEDADTRYGHGLAPSQDQTEVIMGFSGWPLPADLQQQMPRTASLTDLFVTLFDVLHLQDAKQSCMHFGASGASLLRSSAQCHMMVQPRQAFAPDAFALSDGVHKLSLRIGASSEASTRSAVTFLKMTDMNDRPVNGLDLATTYLPILKQCLPICSSMFFKLLGE